MRIINKMTIQPNTPNDNKVLWLNGSSASYYNNGTWVTIGKSSEDVKEDNFNDKGYKILRKNIQSVNIASTKITIIEVPSSDGTLSFTINGKETQIAVSATTDNTTALVAQKVATSLQDSMTEYDVSIDTSLITLTRKSSGLVIPSVFSASTTGVVCTITDSTKREFRNILTQDMINKPNTIYEIRYDFDLNGETINVLENCTLRFEGGSLNNGVVNFNNTTLLDLVKLNVEVLGSITNAVIEPCWFGADNQGIKDSYSAIQKSINFAESLDRDRQVYLKNGLYVISKPLLFSTDNIVTFCGQDRHATTIMGKNPMDYMISSNPSDKGFISTRFERFTLNGNRTGTYYDYKNNTFNNNSTSLVDRGMYFPNGYIYTRISDVGFADFNNAAFYVLNCWGVCMTRLYVQRCGHGICLLGNINGVQVLYSEFNTIKNTCFFGNSSYNLELSNNTFEVSGGLAIYTEASNCSIRNNYFETICVNNVNFKDYDNNEFSTKTSICINGRAIGDQLDEPKYSLARAFPCKNVSILNNTFQVDNNYLMIISSLLSGNISDNYTYNDIPLLGIEFSSNTYEIKNINISRNTNHNNKLIQKFKKIGYLSAILSSSRILHDIVTEDNSFGINSRNLSNHIGIQSSKVVTQTDNNLCNKPIFHAEESTNLKFMINDGFDKHIINVADLNSNFLEVTYYHKNEDNDEFEKVVKNIYISEQSRFNINISKGYFTIPIVKVVGEHYANDDIDKYTITNVFDGTWDNFKFKNGTKLEVLNNDYVDYKFMYNGKWIKHYRIVNDSPSNVLVKIAQLIGNYQGLLVKDDNNTIYILSGNSFKILNMPAYLTTQRPESVNEGFQYFDSTLNKPIWWTGTKWVDATGADV